MMSIIKPRLGLLSLICLLSACQTFKDGDRQLYEQSDRLFKESLEQTQAKVAPPASVQAALIPPLALDAPVQAGPRFDVAANDMPAREFFLSLMDSAGQNLLVHPEVTGNITFSLRNVTLEEVLAAVRDSYGYDYRRTSYGYQVLPNRMSVKTYDLDYLDLEREGIAETRVSSGQVVSSENDITNDSRTRSSRTSSTQDASRVTTRSKTALWKSVLDAVSMIVGVDRANIEPDDFKIQKLSSKLTPAQVDTEVKYKEATCRSRHEGPSVCYSSMSGVLTVRAASEDHAKVAEFLSLIQRNLQRQVILEAKILEVNLSDGFQAGINWSQLGSFGNADITLGLQGDALAGAQGIGGVFSAIVQNGDFTGVLQLLETQGDVRVLSSPRVSTLNNQKAVIKVGTDEFFVTDVSTTTTTLAGGTTAPDLDITLTPFFSGISLDVTPQIDENDQVTLHVRPTVSRVQDQNKTIQLGSDDNVFNLPLALSTTRQSDSIVRARSGQVVVIGGLMENRNTNTDANVPWASKLPVVGALFQQQRKALQQTELVILLRPQVIDDRVWLDDLRKSAESFNQVVR
ncbi:pilus (MSHA type) biogenesis protein MshL [Pseudomonas sp. S5(2021)]|uniref:pilus (MSHA type) biogenesis protein MshL n=1 Tax=Stutzerimonas balearica TaxID=74829 RepID=UPI001CC677B6|nr:pilus (MSHA type) biogenesis protein MshL [Stutzerimonas balearica]MBZ5756916.1 pilus (MSHA type) biogenesis protein MshL [Pseudomonas sp. S5(2021)]MCZ4127733.1 pilus (MSHA type) biogenesis protein MshL [Stutzerimonas balearica]